MGIRAITKFLTEFLNKEIPDEDYIFRRVPLNIFLQGRPDHRLDMVPQIFRNEKGGGISVDWERICNDPKITQTRDGKKAENFGVVVLSYFDVKKFPQRPLKVINDQINYDCHCSLKGIPMSKNTLKKLDRELYDSLSNEQKGRLRSIVVALREYLVEKAFWIITLRSPKIKNPPPDFNYSDNFTEKIKDFFSTREHLNPS